MRTLIGPPGDFVDRGTPPWSPVTTLRMEG
jgi:hypothetical protein